MVPVFVRSITENRVGTAERREFTVKSDYETCNITVLLIFLTPQTSNSIRHMIKLGGKL